MKPKGKPACRPRNIPRRHLWASPKSDNFAWQAICRFCSPIWVCLKKGDTPQSFFFSAILMRKIMVNHRNLGTVPYWCKTPYRTLKPLNHLAVEKINPWLWILKKNEVLLLKWDTPTESRFNWCEVVIGSIGSLGHCIPQLVVLPSKTHYLTMVYGRYHMI